MTTLVTNYEDLAEFRLAVNEWWRDLCGVDPVLEMLATELPLMAPNQRSAFAELVPGSWSVRANLVMFPKNSTELEAEARHIVMESALLRN